MLRPLSRLRELKSLKKLEIAHRQLELTKEVVVVVHAVVTDPEVIVVVEVVVIDPVNQDQKVKVMIDPEVIVEVVAVETDQELPYQTQLQARKLDQLLKLIVQNALKDVVVAEVTEAQTSLKENLVKMLTH